MDFDLEAVNDYVKSARKKSDLERTELNKDKTGVLVVCMPLIRQ
jgi:hypothetical protein